MKIGRDCLITLQSRVDDRMLLIIDIDIDSIFLSLKQKCVKAKQYKKKTASVKSIIISFKIIL